MDLAFFYLIYKKPLNQIKCCGIFYLICHLSVWIKKSKVCLKKKSKACFNYPTLLLKNYRLIIRVCLDTTYFAKTEKLLLKVL